jgi:hypothetical protein
MFEAKGIIEKNLPIINHNGPPGGCGTIREYEAAEISPGSQNETEGCTVKNKIMFEIKNTTVPIIRRRSFMFMIFT